uniref:Uncharacterized protein n=1 Tax=viral metagenome TaxID=1070528 RepID=A0A6C0I4K3_9ZZZZ
MNQKYVMATIRLPILIKEDKTIEPLVDLINMMFEPCSDLPEKTLEKHNYQSLLHSILSHDAITQLKEEVGEQKKEEEVGEQKKEEEVVEEQKKEEVVEEQKKEEVVEEQKKEEVGEQKKEEVGEPKKEEVEEKKSIVILAEDILPKRAIDLHNITLRRKRAKIINRKTAKHFTINIENAVQELMN